MKAVLVGTDLMYRQDGKLVPIEMNTQVGLNNSGRLENYEDFLDFSNLVAFIQSNNITDVYLEGAVSIIKKYWPEELQDVNVSVVAGFKEEYDEPGKLYVRTRYSGEALVDAFCRDKVEFLKSIKDKDFGSEFVVKTLEGLEGEITTLTSNGDLPNFIVKYRYPAYDRSEYPKLLKFRTLRELNSWVKSNLEQDYFIMPFYFNESKLYEGRYGKRLKVMRNWSLFLSEDGTSLTSLDLGTYTRFTEEILDENSREYDGHVLVEGRKQLLVGTGEYSISDLLAEKDDLILMTDGTWKEVQDLKIGEEVKAVSFGDKNLKLAKSANYGSLEDLVSTSEYVSNEIVRLQKVVGFYNEVNLTFEDGSDWFDTENSAYPVVVSENEIRFKELKDIEVGDSIILIPVSAENEEKPSFTVKEVTGISKERKEQEGYSLGLNGNHLFLSRTSEDSAAYIAIEHNINLPSTIQFDNFSVDERVESSIKTSCPGLGVYSITVGVTGNLNNPGFFKVWVIDACETQAYCLVNRVSTQELLDAHVFQVSNDSTPDYGTAQLRYANIGTDEEDCLPCYGDGRSEYPFRVYFAVTDNEGVVPANTEYPYILKINDGQYNIELADITTEDSLEILDFPRKMIIEDN